VEQFEAKPAEIKRVYEYGNFGRPILFGG